MNTSISNLGQCMIQNVPCFLINADVHGCIHTFQQHFLLKRRCIDIAKITHGGCHSCNQIFIILHTGFHCDIADTFTRNRQCFAVRIYHDGILVVMSQIWHFNIICQLPVRFIGNQIDWMTILLLFFLQNICYHTDRLFCIYCPCWIIRCINQYKPGFW